MFFEVYFVETHCLTAIFTWMLSHFVDFRWSMGESRDGRRVEPLESWTGRHTQQQRVSLALMN